MWFNNHHIGKPKEEAKWQYWFGRARRPENLLKKHHNYLEFSKVFFPTRVCGVHWICIVADIQERLIYWYDPYGESEMANHYRKAAGYAMAVVHRILTDDFEQRHHPSQRLSPSFEVCGRPHVYLPLQKDTHSCGAFVCTYMLLYGALGVSETEAREMCKYFEGEDEDIEQIRMSVIEYILRNIDGYPYKNQKWREPWVETPLLTGQFAAV